MISLIDALGVAGIRPQELRDQRGVHDRDLRVQKVGDQAHREQFGRPIVRQGRRLEHRARARAQQLGAVQILVALTFNALIVLGAGASGAFLARRPGWLRVQRYATGGALGALAVSVALDRTRPAPIAAG
ncbi:MAG: hypothetical protein ABWX59_05750 [Microbacteriaceae bacterium]